MINKLKSFPVSPDHLSSDGGGDINSLYIATEKNILFQVYFHNFFERKLLTFTGVGEFSSVPVVSYELTPLPYVNKYSTSLRDFLLNTSFVSCIAECFLSLIRDKEFEKTDIVEAAINYLNQDYKGLVYADYVRSEIDGRSDGFYVAPIKIKIPIALRVDNTNDYARIGLDSYRWY